MDFIKMVFKICVTCLILVSAATLALVKAGKPSFASYYGDHMVLQKGKGNTVWGYADTVGEKITVRVTGRGPIDTAVVHEKYMGKNIWKVMLPSESGPGPVNITASSNDGSATITDVLFGDVWICSGQSNMQFTLSMAYNSSEEIEDAVNYPDIRLFTAAERWSNMSQYDLLGIDEKWTPPNNDSVGHSDWSYFSAVCWFYGKYLYKHLNYPIGLIATTWGGTPIESWSSTDAINTCSEPGRSIERKDSSNVRITPPQNYPTVLWNAMIHPFLNLTIYGAIWYQGEANAAAPDRYRCQFPIMIDDWRKKFNAGSGGQTDSTFPFGFVQLAPWRNDSSIVKGFPDIRWHQTCDFGFNPNPQMPKTFMAVAMDLPDFTSPYGSIHPRDKQDVAARLVLSALNVAYNKTETGKFQGPQVTAYFIDIGYFTLGIELDHSKTPITVRSTDGFEVCCSLNNQSRCDGSDSKWIPAPIITHDSTSVTMSYKDGCARQWVMGLRYAWRESPCPFRKCAVYTVENQLPMAPFITYGLIGQTSQDGLYK